MNKSYEVEGNDESFHINSDNSSTPVNSSEIKSKNVIGLDDPVSVVKSLWLIMSAQSMFVICAITDQSSSGALEDILNFIVKRTIRHHSRTFILKKYIIRPETILVAYVIIVPETSVISVISFQYTDCDTEIL